MPSPPDDAVLATIAPVSAASPTRGSLAGAETWTTRGRLSKRWVTIAVVVAIGGLLYFLINGGAWVYDDNVFMIQVSHTGLTWDWLTAPIYQHWGIAYQLVYAVIHKLMPLDYRWALAGMLVTLLAATYLLQRIVSFLFGWGWRAVLIAGYFCLSIFFVRNLQWLASGLQAVPAAFWDLLCLYAYVRFQIDGSRRWIALAAGALAGGLLFYERPLYMLLYLVLFRILFLAEDLRPRALARTFLSERFMWAALLLVAAVWAFGYQEAGAGQGLTAGHVTIAQYVSFFRILWAQTLIPGLVGSTVPAVGVSAIEVVIAVALQLVLIGVVAFSLHRKSSAWRAWVFYLIPVLFSGLVVARSRIPMFGVLVGRDLRYLTDFAWIAPLSVAFAFYGRRTVTPRVDNAGAALSRPRRLSVGLVTSVAAAALYAVLASITAAKLQRDWPGHTARAWETALQRGLAAARSGGRSVVLADAEVPPFIVDKAFTPLNRLASIVPLYAPGTNVDGVIDGPLWTVAPDGTPHPARVAAEVAPSDMGRLVATRQVTVVGAARLRYQGGRVCITAGPQPAEVTRTLGPINNPVRVPFDLRLTYAATDSAVVPVAVDAGHGYPPISDRMLRVVPGRGSSILFLDAPAPRRIRITIDPGVSLCISGFAVITLGAA